MRLASTVLGIGLFLWFLYGTDYSLPGTWLDLAAPLVVLVAGLAGLGRLRRRKRLACVPALVGGALYVLAGFIQWMPPFTLGAMFAAGEIADEMLIQQAASPDGMRVAEVYFRGVGAYAGGNGRVFVRVHYALFPLLERDVYYVPASYAHKDTHDYLEWQDNDTLYIREHRRAVTVGVIRAEVPEVIAIPVYAVRYWRASAEEERRTEELTEPVRAVPAYPDAEDDQAQVFPRTGGLFRSFGVPESDTDTVAAWYRSALAQAPWSLLQEDRQEEPSTSRPSRKSVSYCLQVERDEGNGARRKYYIEVHGGGQGDPGVHVNIGSPEPITDVCRR